MPVSAGRPGPPLLLSSSRYVARRQVCDDLASTARSAAALRAIEARMTSGTSRVSEICTHGQPP